MTNSAETGPLRSASNMKLGQRPTEPKATDAEGTPEGEAAEETPAE